MSNLTEHINIGKKLAEKLETAEIESFEKLRALGTENAFIRLKTVDKTACINMLYALEGAIQDIRWHNLSTERKQELSLFYEQLGK